MTAFPVPCLAHEEVVHCWWAGRGGVCAGQGMPLELQRLTFTDVLKSHV